MAGMLPADFVARYARPPSDTTVKRAVSIHQGVRELLGDAEYATLLQGSYKNDTALWDMNDVDIVAVSRNLVSSHFTGAAPTNPVPWTEIFSRIERKLQGDPRYEGKWTREDKCIRLNTDIRIDIVPAVRVGDADADPISIYSFRAKQERKNWPRGHYDAGAEKSGLTSGAYKQAVRLFKRWRTCWFGKDKTAPSYYLECLVHARANERFSGDLAQDFITIGGEIAQMQYGVSELPRLAGEGNLLTPGEWESSKFSEFQNKLRSSLRFAEAALSADSEARARAAWVSAFNGQQPS